MPAAGKSAPGKAQGPGTAHALTALLPRTFDLQAVLRDVISPLGESTFSELDFNGNVQTKLKEIWPKTMTLFQFETASLRCKESVYADVSDAYQSHIDFVKTKWDSGIGIANLLSYDKAMRQKYAEHPDLGFPLEDQMLVFKHLITPNLLRMQQVDGPVAGPLGKRTTNDAPRSGSKGGGGNGGPSRSVQHTESCYSFGCHGGVLGCDGSCREDRKHFCLKCGVDYGKQVPKCPKGHKGNVCVLKNTYSNKLAK